MRRKIKRFFHVATVLMFSQPAFALINGGFDDGTLIFESPFVVRSAEGLPGWTLVSTVVLGYNAIPISGAYVSIHDQDSTFYQPLFGRFGVSIHGGFNGQGERVAASIEQGTFVPFESRSVIFLGQSVTPGFSVSFAGQPLPYFEVARYDGYSAYGADMTSLAGTSGTLAFSSAFGSRAFIDSVRFSTFVVPEPSTASLAAAGLAALLFLRRRFDFHAGK